MSTCPICSSKTLRHITHNRVYWYCTHCHEEVPDLLQCLATKSIETSTNLKKRELAYGMKS